jgi:hypothetical protein
MRAGLIGQAVSVCAALAFTPFAAADDSLVCRNSIVSLGMTTAEVTSKCGEPTNKNAEQVPIQARTARGGTIVIGQTTVERWLYDRGTGRFPAELVFEEGKLKTIELLTQR